MQKQKQPEELKVEWNIQVDGKLSKAETLNKNLFHLLGIGQQTGTYSDSWCIRVIR